jgi:hypothetical protein
MHSIVVAAGLSNGALMFTHAANAGGAPAPIISAATELDSKNPAVRPRSPMQTAYGAKPPLRGRESEFSCDFDPKERVGGACATPPQVPGKIFRPMWPYDHRRAAREPGRKTSWRLQAELTKVLRRIPKPL